MGSIFYKVSKTAFIGLLAVLFVWYFALPSLILFLKEDSIINYSKMKSKDGRIPPPLITVCPGNVDSTIGWKTDLHPPGKFAFPFYEKICPNLIGSELISCIDNSTFTLKETILEYLGMVVPSYTMDVVLRGWESVIR